MRNRIKMRNNLTSGGGYKLVWTNPNPNVAFAEQTLNNLNLKYKHIIVYVIHTKNYLHNDYTYACVIHRENGNEGMLATYEYTSTYDYAKRDILSITDNSIQFDYARHGGSIDNNYVIPLKIYGTNIDIS